MVTVFAWHVQSPKFNPQSTEMHFKYQKNCREHSEDCKIPLNSGIDCPYFYLDFKSGNQNSEWGKDQGRKVKLIVSRTKNKPDSSFKKKGNCSKS